MIVKRGIKCLVYGVLVHGTWMEWQQFVLGCFQPVSQIGDSGLEYQKPFPKPDKMR